ncbi:hypothetical protein [Pontibacter sp. G13]|nr:hypothetical protein [Pontibacter sp. G13]WNJ21266.1 hypothetical protein RJD25_12425 [Pontibacter sp. G13]
MNGVNIAILPMGIFPSTDRATSESGRRRPGDRLGLKGTFASTPGHTLST